MKIARLKEDAEIFFSLQGEGAQAGTPAVFVRMAGCNLHCSWCDTKYSWGSGVELAVEEVARRVAAFSQPHVVLTGGEPLLQQPELERLLALLPPDTFVEVETNGTVVPSPALLERVDQWNVSPKLAHAGNATPDACVREALDVFAQSQRAWFKFVVRGEGDWPQIAALQLPAERIILMPCAADRPSLEAARPAVAEMCLRHRVRLGDRLHIVLWNTEKGK